MKRSFALVVAALFLVGELAGSVSGVFGDSPSQGDDGPALDLFDAMQDGTVDAKFIARDSHRGRIVLTNNTPHPITVELPDAFIGVPQVQAQFGGGGGGFGGGGGGLGGGGQQQSVGGGGGGGRGGRGGGGRGGGGFGGRGGGGRGGGGRFSIPPEKVVRVDVPLLCLDHGLREPSSSKPYAIRPIENYIDQPAIIEIVAAYANGDLPTGAAQAAVWNLNSGVGWDELATKLTGTERNLVREPYFSGEEIQSAMAIVEEAERATADQLVEPREFKVANETTRDDVAKSVSEAAEDDAKGKTDDPSVQKASVKDNADESAVESETP